MMPTAADLRATIDAKEAAAREAHEPTIVAARNRYEEAKAALAKAIAARAQAVADAVTSEERQALHDAEAAEAKSQAKRLLAAGTVPSLPGSTPADFQVWLAQHSPLKGLTADANGSARLTPGGCKVFTATGKTRSTNYSRPRYLFAFDAAGQFLFVWRDGTTYGAQAVGPLAHLASKHVGGQRRTRSVAERVADLLVAPEAE